VVTSGLVLHANAAVAQSPSPSWADLSGMWNTLALGNAPALQSAGNVSYYAFNGVNQDASSALVQSSVQQFSVSVWFSTTSASPAKLVGLESVPTGANSSAGVQFDRQLYVGSDGRLYFGVAVSSPSGSKVTVSSAVSVATGAWTHAVGVYDGTSLYLYVNGTLAGSATVGASVPTYAGWWRVASYNLNGWPVAAGSVASGGAYFAGSIAAVQVRGGVSACHYVKRYVLDDSGGIVLIV
jgi:hypothetical protein